MKKVLNVGGNNKSIELPSVYDGWEHILLDIDPTGKPDIVCDAREMGTLEASSFDSVFCSHNLEHYYRHDVKKVLLGFMHVLNNRGFVYLRVPDIGEVMRKVVNEGLDIDDFLYESPAGPILVRDVISGYGEEIERTGEDFYAHKTGFTPKALLKVLNDAGFQYVHFGSVSLEIIALGFKTKPDVD